MSAKFTTHGNLVATAVLLGAALLTGEDILYVLWVLSLFAVLMEL